jgi:hypothetical protein
MDSHKIIQLNLQKSGTARNELIAHMLANNISLALVQEPFVCRHGSLFKVPHLNGLQLAAVTSAKFLSAIIFNKDCVAPLFVPQFSNDHIAVVTLQLGKTQVFFSNVYLPPSTDIRSEIPTIHRIIRRLQVADWSLAATSTPGRPCGATYETMQDLRYCRRS